jgi:hypothetical protein
MSSFTVLFIECSILSCCDDGTCLPISSELVFKIFGIGSLETAAFRAMFRVLFEGCIPEAVVVDDAFVVTEDSDEDEEGVVVVGVDDDEDDEDGKGVKVALGQGCPFRAASNI